MTYDVWKRSRSVAARLLQGRPLHRYRYTASPHATQGNAHMPLPTRSTGPAPVPHVYVYKRKPLLPATKKRTRMCSPAAWLPLCLMPPAWVYVRTSAPYIRFRMHHAADTCMLSNGQPETMSHAVLRSLPNGRGRAPRGSLPRLDCAIGLPHRTIARCAPLPPAHG